jgi:predicted phosphodiesterase
MRVAILSDVHGNTAALDAVLDDIERAGGVDAYWVLGDLAAMGPDPVGAMERLNDLQNATFVRGNTDRYVCGLLDPQKSTEWIASAPGQTSGIVSRLAMLCWAQGALMASGWLNWLATLGLDHRVTLPDGTRVLLVHAAPGTDDGDGINPGLQPDALAKLVEGCEAELLIVGHTHWQLDITVGKTRIINLGSVAVPWAGDLRASYYVLQADEKGHTLEHRRVDYDHQAVIEQLKRQKHPGAEYLGARYRGEINNVWS